MHDPSQQEKPQHRCQDELKSCHEHPALQQLSQTGYEEAGERSDHISSRALSGHRQLLSVVPERIGVRFPRQRTQPAEPPLGVMARLNLRLSEEKPRLV